MRKSMYLKNSPDSVLRFKLTRPSQSLLGAALHRRGVGAMGSCGTGVGGRADWLG